MSGEPLRFNSPENQESVERERAWLALDMLAEQYGQAEWQSFKRDHPEEFWTAKIRVDAGPKGLSIRARLDHGEPQVHYEMRWCVGSERFGYDYILNLYALEDYPSLFRHFLGNLCWDVRPTAIVLSERTDRDAARVAKEKTR